LVIDEAILIRFHRKIENREKYPKSAKLGQKRSCDPLGWNFVTPPYISGTVEAINFKFGTEMACGEY